MGAYRKLHFWKKFIESVLIPAVDISTSVHSDHDVVVVGPLRVAHYGKFEEFPFTELSPVGINMVNHFKHIYPWWIWLSDSIFINVSFIIILGNCSQVSPLGVFSCFNKPCGSVLFCDNPCTWHSWLDTFVLAGDPVFHISCTSPPYLGVF